MQDSQQVKLRIISNMVKIKTQLIRLLVVGLKFCIKSDITIITSMNENIQLSNKSTVTKK